MSITIKEIFPTDTILSQLEKINFNFDQLLLSGGGPRGPIGVQGPIGPSGPAGRRGENTYFDDGTGLRIVPTAIIGDQFVLANGDVYEWDGTNWFITGTNLKGPTGATGPAGNTVDLKRWIGGFASTFPVGTNWYPQIPESAIPSGDIDYITLRQGGLDNLYLGDAEQAYGINGSLSGISNFPNKNNSGKLWIIQNSLVGGGQNGLTIGAIGALESSDDPNTVANYNQFGHLFLDNNGNLNIRITTGGISNEPKSIFINTDKLVSIQAGDVINNQFSVGLDVNDGLVGMYGNLRDKIDLTTLNNSLTVLGNSVLELLNPTSYKYVNKSNISINSGINSSRSITINSGIQTSTDTEHYTDGLSIVNGSKSVKFEMMDFNGTTLASIGATSNTTLGGQNLMVLDNGKVLISPTTTYPINTLSTWINNTTNTNLDDGSLSVYGQLRLNNSNNIQNSLLYSDINGVVGYANSNGIPNNNTNFVVGLWGREVSENRIYPFSNTHFINIGNRVVDDNESSLVVYADSSNIRNATLKLKTDDTSKSPEIVFDNSNKSVVKQAPQINDDKTYLLPQSAGQGGYIATFTDNNGQFDDNWEEYQILREDVGIINPLGQLVKDDLELFALGALTGGYSTDQNVIGRFRLSSGVDWFQYVNNRVRQRRNVTKIHLKRLNRQFYFLNFSIVIFIPPFESTNINFNNFNFFEIRFKVETPGELKILRNLSSIHDLEGGVWLPANCYQSGVETLTYSPPTSTTPISSVDSRMSVIVDSNSYNSFNNNMGTYNFKSSWSIERESNNVFKLQLSTSEPIDKTILETGITFTGSSVVYGQRSDDVNNQ